MAVDPLPSSYLFAEALRGPSAFDNDFELKQWDREPPYVYEAGDSDDGRRQGQCITSLVDAMHGRRLRQARQQEDARIARVEAGDVNGVRDSMQADFEDALRNWKNFIGGHILVVHCSERDSKAHQMARLWIQWRAQAAYHLHEELQALKVGTGVFINTIYGRRNV
jgi:hypothetical protein